LIIEWSSGRWCSRSDKIISAFELEKPELLLRFFLICSILMTVAIVAVAQTQSVPARRIPKKVSANPQPTPPSALEPSPAPAPAASPVEEQQEVETLKITTNLVTVPVIATTAEGNYIPDLRQEEFSISEDGEKQEVAFFATVSAPFHVVLLLDTSASTQDKLNLIQQAAVAFVEQLQGADRVKVISFDSDVRELSDFTNDRAALKGAIYKTVSGRGTKLYDAFELALSSIRTIRGRKAIVLFSDGVDWHSDQATFDSTLHWLDEEGVIVYPIRYETRAQTERIAREAQADPANQLPTIDVIRRAPSGTTAPTFPSDNPDSVPTSGQSRKTGPLGLPTAAEIMRGRRQRDPDMDRFPSPDRLPPSGPTSRPDHDPGDVGGRRPDPRDTRPLSRGNRRRDDSIDFMLDSLYLKADSYLMELANKSGGRLLRADTLGSLPDAFAKIAAELRTQYAIGYYPTNKTRDGQYRKIKVTSTRKNIVLRARPGYRAPSGG
jgi:von Willebrand factor type A domain